MKRLAGAVAGAVLLAGLAACTSSSDGSSGSPGTTAPSAAAARAQETAGLIPATEWRARQDDYLAFATSAGTPPTSPLAMLAFATTAERDGKQPDIAGASVADFADTFAKLEAFEDTGDFDINELLFLWRRQHQNLDPELEQAIRQHILAFKYWWTEPTPKGVVDSQYYWTENHQAIYLANEYVAGQTWPTEVFTNSGMTGKEHVAHARPRLEKWFSNRARFGFSEWLSNVYWTEDLKGMLLLAEFATDPQIARQASMILDMMFVELAGHVQQGTFGSTHGRTYQKDKLNGRDEDTFSIAKLAFDQTPVPYASADNATLLATATRYRPPEVARKIAASQEPAVFQTTSGIPLDPNAPIDPKAKAPYGTTYKGEDGLMTYWGMGAQFPWQMVPTSVATVKRYDLFQTSNFQQAADLAPVVESSSTQQLRELARSLAIKVNPGLLSQVDTYTWRSPAVMLSTAQDWRPGQRGEQDHIWQATFDPDTLVFTQHPKVPVSTSDAASDNNSYWTGDGAIPRSAQHQNVNITIYDPSYPNGGGVGSGSYSFTYQDHTHAWFPTEEFDEVVQRDGWTIGKKGDGFIALWSARPTTWRRYATGEFTNGLTKDFDLVAEGGPQNVWITEVAQASDYAGNADPFDSFVQAITASKPVAAGTALCPAYAKCRADVPLSVTYTSPSQGTMTYGWDPTKPDDQQAPFTVDGAEVDLHPDGQRWAAPFAKASFDDGTYRAKLDGATLELDFNAKTRITTR